MPTTTTGLATSFISFSRPGATGGGATVTDRDGRIKWAGHNLLTNSESFGASTWISFAATATENVTTAPNATTTADKICEWTGTGAQTRYQTFSVGSAGTTFTFTVYAKKSERNFINVSLSSSVLTDWVAATFNLDTVAVTQSTASGTGYAIVGTPSISAIGDNWCRCVLTVTFGGSGTHYCFVGPGNTGAPTYGNQGLVNATGTAPNGVFVWGAHLYRSDLGGMQLNAAMPSGMQTYYPTTPRNLVGWTEDWTSASWVKTNILAFGSGSVANAATAPNGLQTADLIVPNTTSGVHTVDQTFYAILSNTPYQSSVYVKAAGYSKIGLLDNAAANRWSSFNLTGSGSVIANGASATGAITALSDGWYRISLSENAGTTALAFTIYVLSDAYTSGNPSSHSYAGNGTSGVYLWGAQLSDSASLDTYVPVYGAAVTSAAAYAPRLDFDGATLAAKGLLVEEQRTNVALWSEAFDNVAWAGSLDSATRTANTTTAPSGATTADTITAVASTASHYIGQSITWTAAVHTVSVYVKRGTQQFFQITTWDGTTSRYANFDILNGTKGNTGNATSTILPVGDNWYRVTMTSSTAHAAAAGNVSLAFATSLASSAQPSFTAAGTETFYLWGAQLEAGSFATSYIPTGSATATRAADVASVSTQAFPYSSSEGTIVVSGNAIAPFSIANDVPLSMDLSASADTRVSFYRLTTTNVSGVYIPIAGTPQANLTGGAIAANTNFKVGAAMKENDFAFTKDGGAVATDTSGSVPATVQMTIGRTIYTASQFSGYIRQITYLPRRISNAELQSRTA